MGWSMLESFRFTQNLLDESTHVGASNATQTIIDVYFSNWKIN